MFLSSLAMTPMIDVSLVSVFGLVYDLLKINNVGGR